MRKIFDKWFSLKPGNVLCTWFPRWFVPNYKKLSKASCWQGSNAQTRHMNILSPHFSDHEFERRVRWAKHSRSCNTLHLFINNQGDGEGAGYAMYGMPFNWREDKGQTRRALKRMRYARRKGLGICIWIFADDSRQMNREAATNFDKVAKDLHEFGLDTYASSIVSVLEAGESYNAVQLRGLVDALRKHCKLPVGTHENSDEARFASLGDFVMYQTKTGRSIDWLRNDAVKRDGQFQKPWWYFEIERQPCRDKCQALFDLKLPNFKGVGNW